MNASVEKKLVEFAILFISEKTFYYEKETDSKYYLCKALSEKYENYRNKIYWKRMIDYKKILYYKF